MKEIFINLEKEAFLGNVIDMGVENYGIVYDLCKKIDDNINIGYVEDKNSFDSADKYCYDSCVIFFSIFKMKNFIEKDKLFKKAAQFLKDKGMIYIWDVDKPRLKVIKFKLKIAIPLKGFKEIKINALNPLSNDSSKSTCKILNKYFNVIDLKCSDNIYYIKAQKKGSRFSENITNSH
ncbi:MAG: hypothetical protein PHX70_02475 [Clostridium sp.]|nr:hypothetical protein [Clostridium sp.]